MKEAEMKIIAGFIDRAISNNDDEEELQKIKSEVNELCSRFPLYPQIKSEVIG
jgi:glycine hydroxymethyltransferase